MRFRLVRSLLVEWGVFSGAFQDCIIPWSVRKESCLRVEELSRVACRSESMRPIYVSYPSMRHVLFWMRQRESIDS